VPDIQLAGRNWAPIFTYEQNGDVRLVTDQLQPASVRFDRNRVAGRTPCPRDYFGLNQRSGLAVTIFDLDKEGARCKARKFEKNFLETLERVASHALRGPELELLDVEGRPVMRLVAQPGLRDLPWRVVRFDVTPNAPSPKLQAPRKTSILTADFLESGVLSGLTGRTTFNAFYNESGGATLDITEVTPDTAGCRGRKANTPECRLETRYLNLLRDVDGYEMRTADGLMVLLRGNRVSLELEPFVANGG
jgi:hypothetical protein